MGEDDECGTRVWRLPLLGMMRNEEEVLQGFRLFLFVVGGFGTWAGSLKK